MLGILAYGIDDIYRDVHFDKMFEMADFKEDGLMRCNLTMHITQFPPPLFLMLHILTSGRIIIIITYDTDDSNINVLQYRDDIGCEWPKIVNAISDENNDVFLVCLLLKDAGAREQGGAGRREC